MTRRRRSRGGQSVSAGGSAEMDRTHHGRDERSHATPHSWVRTRDQEHPSEPFSRCDCCLRQHRTHVVFRKTMVVSPSMNSARELNARARIASRATRVRISRRRPSAQGRSRSQSCGVGPLMSATTSLPPSSHSKTISCAPSVYKILPARPLPRKLTFHSVMLALRGTGMMVPLG